MVGFSVSRLSGRSVARSSAVHGAIHDLEIGQRQFRVDRDEVIDGVQRIRCARHIARLEDSHHMDKRIRFPHVVKEAVSQSLAARRSFDQPRDVHELDNRSHLVARRKHLVESVQASVGDLDYSDIGVDRAERVLLSRDGDGGQRPKER
jgi:hypothetical protein